jgi:hypothetical protein
MPSLKPLKSVAHNLAHQFASTLNYVYDDYAINHLAKAAHGRKSPVIVIDVLNNVISPPDLKAGIVLEIITPLKASLAEILEKEGFSIDMLDSATLTYNFNVDRVDALFHQPTYDCVSSLKTKTGRGYEAHLTEENN